MTIRVVVADDQQLVRAGFRYLLDAHDDITVVGEAVDGADAVRQCAALDPDVVLMDIRMPGTDGLEATRALVARGPRPVVLVLTTFDADRYVFEALTAGASGFLLKDVSPDTLAAAVRTVAAGDALLAPAITRRLVERFLASPLTGSGRPPALRGLTERELDVLRLVGRGLSNREIAIELVLAETTVKTHVAHVLAKTGCRDRVQAVVLAHATRLVVVRGGGIP